MQKYALSAEISTKVAGGGGLLLCVQPVHVTERGRNSYQHRCSNVELLLVLSDEDVCLNEVPLILFLDLTQYVGHPLELTLCTGHPHEVHLPAQRIHQHCLVVVNIVVVIIIVAVIVVVVVVIIVIVIIIIIIFIIIIITSIGVDSVYASGLDHIPIMKIINHRQGGYVMPAPFVCLSVC